MTRMPSVLSVQSRVAYGHVGNAAAIFPLQCLGVEAWALDTVAFSNHTGHGRWRGDVVAAEAVASLFEGIAELGVLPDIVGRVKAANPAARFCCDPVIGDSDTGSYVRDGVAEFFRDAALALADIVTPNRFELEFLTGRAIGSLAEAVDAAAALRQQGPGTVLVTSLDAEPDRLTMLASGGDGAWAVETPRLAVMLNGCGDVTGALFLGHLLTGDSLADALAATAASMFAVIETTVGLGRYELALVASREELAKPRRVFAPMRV